MFKVKAIGQDGRTVTFACGTAGQALERAQELVVRGFKDVMVTDLRGQVRSLAKFERLVER